MCGIFGVVTRSLSAVDQGAVFSGLDRFFKLSEARGKEAAGLAVRASGRIDVYRSAGSASRMIESAEYRDFLRRCLAQAARSGPIALIGHSRLVTNGWQSIDENNQPVVTRHYVGVHNGIVTNVDAILARNPALERQFDVDTEVIFRLMDRARDRGMAPRDALAEAMANIEGVVNLGYVADDVESLFLASNNGSLYWAANPKSGFAAFASEARILKEAIGGTFLDPELGEQRPRHVKPGTGVEISLRGLDGDTFPLTQGRHSASEGETVPPARIRVHRHDRSALQRCTRCVLPASFPGISFDSNGVCSVCRDYAVPRLHGQNALEKLAETLRDGSDAPNCVVAFSGGRDSSYGLHYIKRELGLNPVAYTYDWGMVTDLARRNQSRLCAKLGVEHVIRSPDIPKKRRYIRKNIEAWLRKPDLGMVPLFMAGDKQFYHYARTVGKEFGVKTIFFCAGNELERTEFKSGFCGVKESKHGQRLYDYSLRNKIGLALYYLGQYLRNPSYINESLLDTLWAYHSTYVAKDDFIYLYHYIPWDEHIIHAILKREYDWEEATDTGNTWRIGDGTAAFYNYIYHTVAGFSEHDTFRSNQIRAGLISRKDALMQIAADNRPRWESMRQYAELIGFNLEEALLVINSMKKRY